MIPAQRITSSFLNSAILALFFVLMGCGENSTDPGIENGPGNDNGIEEPGPNEVWMVGQSFNPSTLEVDIGTTVTWENNSQEIHTVTSGSDRNHDGLFDSGNISPGATYTHTFHETGTFDYFCVPHSGMNGTIIVTD